MTNIKEICYFYYSEKIFTQVSNQSSAKRFINICLCPHLTTNRGTKITHVCPSGLTAARQHIKEQNEGHMVISQA